MCVRRAQAEENCQAVINVASRLFRAHGFDGIGLKDLMEGAGLTQGTFYKQFSSTQDLIRLASGRALESVAARCMAAIAENPGDPLAAVVSSYLSKDHRQDLMDGCPLVALSSDAAPQPAEAKATFEDGMQAYLDMLVSLLPASAVDKTDAKAMSTLSLMIGALMLSGMVNSEELSQSFLDNAIEQMREGIPA